MIDIAASEKHYLEHLLPVWRCLPAEHRGIVYLGAPIRALIPDALPLEQHRNRTCPVMIAGHEDARHIGDRPLILMEHGCGQSYRGDPKAAIARNPAYAGGDGRHGILAFLCPNEYAAAPNRARNPDALVEVIGSPYLESLQDVPAAPPGERPVVAFSWHWDYTAAPETRNAWDHFAAGLRHLAETGDFEILGHAHPRLIRDLSPTYRRMGIEPVPDFVDVLRRAQVFCVDNSSALYTFAALRGPVVVMDAPGYRRHVEHGLRFWDAADVGPRISDSASLPAAIRAAIAKQPWPGAEEILARVFPAVEQPARTAAAAAIRAAERTVTPRKVGGFPRIAG